MIIKGIVYDYQTKEFKIIEEEYEDPEVVEEVKKTIEEQIEELTEVNITQDKLIDTTMLATDEIFTMIEPILDLVPQNLSLERGVSKMVDMYVAMIQRGIKTIDQVPVRYREEVRRVLEELEK